MNQLPTLLHIARPVWLVNSLGNPDDGYEISIVREDDKHGQKSWGWYSSTKILISEGNKVPRPIWDRLIEVANESAADLNAIDI